MKRSSLKKTAALVSAAVSLALFTAACGSGDAGDKKASGPVEITFWSWLKGSQDVADAFNASHTDIKVKFEQVPGGPDYYNKLANAVKAGNAPDVATVEYGRVPEVVSQGELQDITGKVGDVVKSKYPQSVQSLVTLGGKTWSVPLDAGAVVLYYRKDLFEKYGVEVPKTWDDYKAAAAKVKAAD
jgi:multiple sugar transport system substrate-binding protein